MCSQFACLLLHVVRLKVTPFGRTSRLPDDAIVRGVRVPLDCDSPAIHSLGSHSPFLCIFGCRWSGEFVA